MTEHMSAKQYQAAIAKPKRGRTFTDAFLMFGPDVPKLAEVLRIRDQDADRLKNWMMDNKPLDAFQVKVVNERCRRMMKRNALRLVREVAA